KPRTRLGTRRCTRSTQRTPLRSLQRATRDDVFIGIRFQLDRPFRAWSVLPPSLDRSGFPPGHTLPLTDREVRDLRACGATVRRAFHECCVGGLSILGDGGEGEAG